MIKNRFAPALIIAIVNSGILTLMLALWTDRLELILNDFIRPIEFLKIICITIASLICVNILTKYLNKKDISIDKKLRYSIVVTLIVSSFFYLDYTYLIIKNRFIDRNLRNSLFYKIQPSQTLAYGTNAKNLTFNEYNLLARKLQFLEIHPQSTNIQYEYAFDGFLPDYYIEISYDLPINILIDSFSISEAEFSKSLSFEVVGDLKRVSYSEMLQ